MALATSAAVKPSPSVGGDEAGAGEDDRGKNDCIEGVVEGISDECMQCHVLVMKGGL